MAMVTMPTAMPKGPIIQEKAYDKKLHKRCIKCRVWKLRKADEEADEKAGFGTHESSSDGLQSICQACKNIANKDARNKNVAAYLRHHIATRCLTQLGKYAPENFTKNLELHLGYKIRALVKHLRQDLQEREGKDRKLRDALNEGYQVDYIRPLSLYKVIVDEEFIQLVGTNEHAWVIGEVIWGEFELCWAMENLSAIPASENLAKGAKYSDD